MVSVHDLSIKKLPNIIDPSGSLIVIQGLTDVPIEISRVFLVSSTKGEIRGRHAHKQLTQVLVCTHGACVVVCDDGDETREFILDKPAQALIIPPGIWAEQEYRKQGSVLMVLCDFPYDEGDYIREYNEFIAFRRGQQV